MVALERKTTPRQQSGRLCRSVAFTVALCVAPYPAAIAKDSGSVQDVVQYPKDEDPKTEQITLMNAIRKSPQDPAIRVEIAKLYFQLGDVASAEREARAARDLEGGEADYLPVLLDAMLARKEFKEIYDEIEPGDRNPVLESKTGRRSAPERSVWAMTQKPKHYCAKRSHWTRPSWSRGSSSLGFSAPRARKKRSGWSMRRSPPIRNQPNCCRSKATCCGRSAMQTGRCGSLAKRSRSIPTISLLVSAAPTSM